MEVEEGNEDWEPKEEDLSDYESEHGETESEDESQENQNNLNNDFKVNYLI